MKMKGEKIVLTAQTVNYHKKIIITENDIKVFNMEDEE